jgi:predicted esterase
MVSNMLTRTIAARTHGRYLVAPPTGPGPSPVLVGFHGYAELADAELQRMQSIPDLDRWLRVAIQGLHRFYRGRTRDVVASWMTSQDRELAIADNLALVSSVIDAVANEWHVGDILVFTGFSQGVAMAFRAACAAARPVSGIVSLGGDVPPELGRDGLARIPAALLGRGIRDDWYTAEKRDSDVERLREAGVRVETVDLDADHEWTAEFSAAAGRFLRAAG